jgi:serine/threonine protein kinase
VLSPEAIDLLASLFNTNADKRPTAKEVLNHKWLDDVSLPKAEPPAPQIVRANSTKHAKTSDY